MWEEKEAQADDIIFLQLILANLNFYFKLEGQRGLFPAGREHEEPGVSWAGAPCSP